MGDNKEGEKEEVDTRPVVPHPDSPWWSDPESNEQTKKQWKEEGLLWSPPYDARFANPHREKRCFTYYVDYWRCRELLGQDYKPCELLSRVYNAVCPRYWVERWDEWRETGRFPARFDR